MQNINLLEKFVDYYDNIEYKVAYDLMEGFL